MEELNEIKGIGINTIKNLNDLGIANIDALYIIFLLDMK